jgi:Holliday junction resolvase
MVREAEIQSKLIKYLKSKGCYVLKTKPGTGIPVGCPDVFAFHEGFWCAFEVKANKRSKFQPLQKETVDKLAVWSFAKVVHSENIDEVISELEYML